MTVHQLTGRQLRAIANGTAGSAELGVLTQSQRSKLLATLALLPRLATRAHHPEAAAAVAGWCLLADVQRRAPGAARQVLRYPPVGAWATQSLLAMESPAQGAAHPGRLALVAAAAAIRGGVQFTLEIPPAHCAGSLMLLPSLGTVKLPGEFRNRPATLRHADGRTELLGGRSRVALPGRLDARAPGWFPLATVTTGSPPLRLRVVLDDADPYRLPGYAGKFARLTSQKARAWRDRIDDGWRLLTRDHRRTAADLLAVITTLTPLSAPRGTARSITSRHAFGIIGLSLPEDDVAMAVTLAHEVQHAKLSALMDLLPLVTEPAAGQYYAPWRPDPRPLAGLLHGIYAHCAVMRFWWHHRKAATGPAGVHRAWVEFARWRAACTEAVQVIGERPELTECGAIFVAEIGRTLRRWNRARIPHAARSEADGIAREHRRAWDARWRPGAEAPGAGRDTSPFTNALPGHGNGGTDTTGRSAACGKLTILTGRGRSVLRSSISAISTSRR